MTTVFIDFTNSRILSDGRTTQETISILTGKVLKRRYTASTAQKVFKYKNFALTQCGDVLLSDTYKDYLRVRSEGKNPNIINFFRRKCFCRITDDSVSNMLLVSSLNPNRAFHVRVEYKKGKGYSIDTQYVTFKSFTTIGSGSEVASKVYELTGDAMKAIRAAAMKDKYTNDRILVTQFN